MTQKRWGDFFDIAFFSNGLLTVVELCAAGSPGELSNLREAVKNLFWYQLSACSLLFMKGVKA